MRVEDVVIAAGVSRRTFYDHFPDKQAAFLAAYDAVVEQLLTRVLEAFEAADGFVGQTSACLGALIDFISSEPAFAHMCIVEVLAAGPEAVTRRNGAMAGLAALVERGADELPKKSRPPMLTAETLVGGIYEVLYSRILQGQIDDIPGLLPDLVYSALLPYVGPGPAGVEATRLRRKRKKV